MPSVPLKVSLIAHTPDPEKTCALAARTCYSGLDMETLRSRVDEKDQADFLRRVVGSGHLSVLEHASFTFSIEGVSRALLAQVTRHRIASFSVQSQRYVSLERVLAISFRRRFRPWVKMQFTNSNPRCSRCISGILTGRKSWEAAKAAMKMHVLCFPMPAKPILP